jgi:hypothetical protein
MSTYKVTLPFIVYVTAEIEADNEEKAIEEATGNLALTNYCGNGGDDRLVGSWNTSNTLEPGDLIDHIDYLPTVELIEGDYDDQA